jgi:DNA-binding NarL/FixJ family response regulator
MKSIRILIVDDQRLFAESLRTVLESMDSDFTVVGLAENGEAALAVVDELTPSIVLMDVRMPKLDGVEATKQLHFRRPELPILMLTTFEDEEYVRHALQYGASGYMLKSISPAELVSCIHAVLNGAVSIDPRVLASLIKPQSTPPGDAGQGSGSAPDGVKADEGWTDSLNRKEKQILGLMVQGFNNKEIAVRLFMAEQTVRNYVSRLYEKIGVADRGKAIRRARETGLF